MKSLIPEIAASFESGGRPNENRVVLRDGHDKFEKESAVDFYAGKTWSDVLAYLRGLKDNPTTGGAYYLEEWSVLSREALPYYLRAHLEFLLETLFGPQPDEEFIFFFLGQLYQVIYIHKGSPFNPAQTILLQGIARSIAEHASDRVRFAYFNKDIEVRAAKFLAELHAHDR